MCVREKDNQTACIFILGLTFGIDIGHMEKKTPLGIAVPDVSVNYE